MIKCLFNTSLLLLYLWGSSGDILGQEDSTKYGKIKFNINVEEALLILNNQFDEAKIISNGETISVKTGRTSVKLSIVQDYLYEEQFVLKEDSLVVVSHEFELKPISKDLLDRNYAARFLMNKNLLVITDPSTQIIIDGELKGKGSFFANVPTGSTEIEFKNELGIQTFYFKNHITYNNSIHNLGVVENYTKPVKKRSQLLSLLPGFSQAYKYEFTKSNIIRLGLGASILGLTTTNILYNNGKKDFDAKLVRYNNTISEVEATSLGHDLESQKTNLETYATLRNLALFTSLGIYTYNILDGLYNTPKIGFCETKPIEFYLNSNQFDGLDLTMKVDL